MPRSTSQEIVQQILELSQQGKTTRQIAGVVNVGKSTVARIIKTGADTPVKNTVVITETIDMPQNLEKAEQFLKDIGEAPVGVLEAMGSESELSRLAEKLNGSSPQASSSELADLADKILAKPRPRARKAVEFASIPVVEKVEEVSQGVQSQDVGSIIAKIQLNVENFAPLLKNIIGDDPAKFQRELYTIKSPERLANLLNVIEKTRSISNLANGFKHAFWMGAGGLEMATQRTGLKTQGFSAALMTQKQEIEMILKEIAIEKLDQFSKAQRPEVRLAFIVSSTLLATDTKNRMLEAAAKQMEGSKVKSETQAKFQDL